MKHTVTLTAKELKLAEFVAKQRNDDGRSAGADSNKYGNERPTYEVHLDGVLGELSFAKLMGMYWTGMGDSYQEDSDVANYQVRSTTYSNGCLIIRPNEGHEHDPWVLMIAEGNRKYRLAGWCYGWRGRQDKYRREPGGRPWAFFVPQPELESPESLRGWPSETSAARTPLEMPLPRWG